MVGAFWISDDGAMTITESPSRSTRPRVFLHDRVDDAFVEQYRRDGFAVLAGALSPADLDAIRAETVRLVRGDLGSLTGAVPIVSAADTDDEVMRKLPVHPLPAQDLAGDASGTCTSRRSSTCSPTVIGPNVKCMQSMLFIKAAGKPGQAWHQDEYFIPTRDRSLTGAWIALDDATIENGCLWVIPGSHKHGHPLARRASTTTERFDCADEAYDFPYTDDDAVPVEVTAGAVVFFNGYLLHRSLPNNGEQRLPPRSWSTTT